MSTSSSLCDPVCITCVSTPLLVLLTQETEKSSRFLSFFVAWGVGVCVCECWGVGGGLSTVWCYKSKLETLPGLSCGSHDPDVTRWEDSHIIFGKRSKIKFKQKKKKKKKYSFSALTVHIFARVGTRTPPPHHHPPHSLGCTTV